MAKQEKGCTVVQCPTLQVGLCSSPPHLHDSLTFLFSLFGVKSLPWAVMKLPDVLVNWVNRNEPSENPCNSDVLSRYHQAAFAPPNGHFGLLHARLSNHLSFADSFQHQRSTRRLHLSICRTQLPNARVLHRHPLQRWAKHQHLATLELLLCSYIQMPNARVLHHHSLQH